MRFWRWVLLLPGALVGGMAGSLAGGFVGALVGGMADNLLGGFGGTLVGQAAADTGSAFVGMFAFVFAAGRIAPSRRNRVAIAVASVVAVLALATFVLGVFTTIEEFAELSSRAKVLTPIAQALGALYAVFLLPPLVTPGTTLERLWREIVALGTIVALFGGLVALAGAVVGLLGHGWIGVPVGLGVLLLGLLTWLFPFVHVRLRMRGGMAIIKEQMRQERVGRDSGDP